MKRTLLVPILGLAITVFCVGVLTSYGQTYSGRASALSVTETVVGQPLVTTSVADTGPLPGAGGNITLTSVGVSVPGIVSVGSSNVSTVGSGDTTESIASVNNLNIGVLSNTITADVISSESSSVCPGSVSTGNSIITGLSINSVPITVTGAPNQTIEIFLLGELVGTLIINEHIIEPRGLTVNALHLFVTDPLSLTTTDVVVASARAGINCLIAPGVNLYGGYGTGVWLRQSDILTGDVSTLISDTGALPGSGGLINASTVGAGLAPLLSTGTVTSSTSGGLPGGDINSAQSDASVEDLEIDALGLITINAGVVQSETLCTCSLTEPTCSGDSVVTDLSFTLPLVGTTVIQVTGLPNQQVVLPLGLGSIVINEQDSYSFATGAGFTVNALRINLNVVGLVATEVIVAASNSEIVCLTSPTSANVSVSGRVTDASGRGIPNTMVTMWGGGESRFARTNPFGFYTFENVSSGETYVMNAIHRSYSFSSRVIDVTDDLTGIDFTPSDGKSNLDGKSLDGKSRQ